MKRYRFLPAARLEATAAATWYRERSHDAAVGFVEEVSAALRAIRERPDAWPAWNASAVRRRVLHRYPYSVYFVLEADVVVIVAVAHHKQRPGYWLPRFAR